LHGQKKVLTFACNETGSVVGWTPLDEMQEAARTIYAEKKAALEAAFSSTSPCTESFRLLEIHPT